MYLLSLVLFVASVFVAVYLYSYFDKKSKQEFLQFIERSGYVYDRSQQFLDSSSFNVGNIHKGLKGAMHNSHNEFTLSYQVEQRGSHRSRRYYHRTIVSVVIPDTTLHMIINSKINNDISSGGNLDLFKDQQRLTLEGHFGDFFDVFMPDQTQSEVLTILSPNSMMYVMQELADYDIEINNNRLYLYTYRHLKITELESLIAKVDRLLAELWLRKEDVRNNNINNAMVARTATYNTAGKRSLKKGVNKIAVLVIVIYVFSYLPENSFSGLGVLVLVICLGVISVKRIFRNALLRRKYERTIGQYKQKNNQQ